MGLPTGLYLFPSRMTFWIEAHPKAAFALLAFFVMVSGWFSEGWLQPDEHSRALEAAHQLVYGYATLPWELDPRGPLVSYLLGMVYSPVLMITKAFGASGLTEAALCRVLTALVAVSRVWAFYLLIKPLGLKVERGISYVLVYLLGPLTLVLLPRTTQENWSTTALMWGTLLVFKAVNSPWKPSRDRAFLRQPEFWAGLLLALGTSFRLQHGFSCLGLGVWFTVQMLCKWKASPEKETILRVFSRLGLFVVGGLVGLIPMAMVDSATFGTPFLPALNYFQYALHDEEGGNLWGQNPWTEYLYGFLGLWYLPYSVVILPIIVLGLVRAPLLASVIVPHLVVHLLLSHKELRYLSMLIPFWTLGFFVGLEALENRYPNSNPITRAFYAIHKGLAGFFYLGALLYGVLALVVLNPQPRFYQRISDLWHQGDLLLPFGFVANSRSGLSQFYLKDPRALPTQILKINDFLKALDQHRLPAQRYVLQRVPIEFLNKVEGVCTTILSSLAPWQRWAYLHPVIGPWIRFRYFDGVYFCNEHR